MPVTIRFVAGFSYVSAAIRAAEYGYGWTHTEAVTPEGKYLGSVFDPTGAADGVRERDPGYDGITQLADPRHCFVELPLTAPQEAVFWAAARQELGKPYDLVDVLNDFVGGRDWRNPNAWWCSELMAHCTERAAEVMAAVGVEKISPRDYAIWIVGLFGVIVPLYGAPKRLALMVSH